MRKIIFIICLLLSVSLSAQKFDTKWKKVVALEQEGKIRSANEEVQHIYKKAKNRKDEAEMVKTFFYTSKYMQVLEEDAGVKIITNLKNDIKNTSIPTQSLLYYIYAKCLESHLVKNGYKIAKLSNVDYTPDADYRTWPLNMLQDTIQTAYQKAIEAETVLLKTPLTQYENVIDFEKYEDFKKYTLYDFLASEAIQRYIAEIKGSHLKNTEKEWLSLFDTSDNFRKNNLQSIKNDALKNSISLYQKLENNPVLRSKYQLKRLDDLQSLFNVEGLQYLKILDRFPKQHTDTLTLQNVLYRKASLYKSYASKKDHPDYNQLALKTYDSLLALGKSNTYKKAANDRYFLTRESFSIQLVKYTYNEQHARALIRYKNLNNCTLSFYKINHREVNSLYDIPSAKRDSIQQTIRDSRKPTKSITYPLQNKGDYFEYTTEIMLPDLTTGMYMIDYDSPDKTYSKETNENVLIVSDIGLLSYIKNEQLYFEALHRKTGKPLEKVIISGANFTTQTDTEGRASIKWEPYNYSYDDYILATQNNDSLYVSQTYVNDYFNRDNRTNDSISNATIRFFLDRAIYRPGQPVYYKGIALWDKNNTTEIIANLTVKVNLTDPNNKTIETLEVKTNEFGSFSGKFILPKSGATGSYSIEAEEPDMVENDPLYNKAEDEHPFWDNMNSYNKTIDFNVEEYKRPNFQITFTPVTKTYAVNQEIAVKGTAKALSGSTISDAKVTYTIKRFARSRYYYQEEGPFIAKGETQTDSNGNFTVVFNAEPDTEYGPEKRPVFNYEVTVDVTDINGETRSEKTTVKAGYHMLNLKLNLPLVIETEKKEFLQLNSENLNDSFIPVKGTLTFYYTAPINNKWKRKGYNPEIKSIDDSTFDSVFPYEKRDNDSIPKTVVLKRNVNTQSDRKIPLDFMSDWKTGNYTVTFSTKDSLGHSIENSANFKLLQQKDKQKPSDRLFTVKQVNPTPLKDGFIKLEVASNFADLYLNADVYSNGIQYYRETFQLRNKQAIIQVPVKTGAKGMIKIEFQTLFDNEVITETVISDIQEEEESLAFEVESIRNKIEPGSHENWIFRIKNKKEAEVLASMYDSSLDQFTKTEWEQLASFRYYNRYVPEKSKLGFGNEYGSLSFYSDTASYYSDISDKTNSLIWFGFNFANPNDPYALLLYKKLVDSGKTKTPANAKTISGTVSEGGLPLPGVSVVVNGTKRGTQTDMDGYYTITASIGDILTYSFVGMETKSVIVKATTEDVVLTSESKQLNEVVVGALGIKARKDEMLKANLANRSSDANMLQALTGKVSGLQVSQAPPIAIRAPRTINENDKPLLIVVDGKIVDAGTLENLPGSELLSTTLLKGSQGTALYGSAGANGVLVITTKKALTEIAEVKTRKNFNETAFFYPHLKTDKEGKIKFSFTTPESLTKWKLRLLGHNKKGKSAYYEDQIITQKELMVTPNFPRFFREKDTLLISAKIANMTFDSKSGIAALQLFDATTMEPIDHKTANQNNIKNFIIPAKGNSEVSWKIIIPEGVQGIQYKVVAKSGNFSDGEENILPVLTNTLFVTESIPLWVRGDSKKTYTLDNLKHNTSKTLRNHQITLEYTSNPTWLALQALPYLMEYEHECAEQTFARYYSNVLAAQIINSNPKIATLFENWRKDGKSISKLEQNEELKSIILAETPWLRDSQSDAEKKKNLALLFDLDKMATSTDVIFDKLKEKQKASGGFPWFQNGNESYYITRHIMAGFGHLSKMQLKEDIKSRFKSITDPGIQYIDSKFMSDHKEQLKTSGLNRQNCDNLYYLYARSFYLDSHPLNTEQQNAINLQLEASRKNWLNYSLYEKALAALVFNRFNDPKTAATIITGLKETAANNTDFGMYWIANKHGWYWYQAPIETQAMLIEAFAEITDDKTAIEAMKVWLLKNKQGQSWPTTKATTEAIYALLSYGDNWLSEKDNTVFKVGNEKIMSKKLNENQKEAETGYIKLNWNQKEISPDMATISIENKSKVPGYGGYYWQYFEDLDKIKTQSGSGLSTSKELYLKKTTDKGTQLELITPEKSIKVGDLVTVRIIIKATEDIEYIHLKDMRASGFEPVNVLSGYQWKEDLSYSQSTRDAATHFFFDHIRKGIYVIEYDVRANNSGHFSNGITTIQSMYAPEFTSHTKGMRVQIKR
ncbi:MG2 domain-containing protein [Flavobacterium cerinum]|uniref:MG2 domain-containing protein n=1 Tax=Flavobacterium cerinum TaxID=2502784 RepID=A0ABY5IVV5_9FLAO|nr:MG2 domain-containing protein [Flavobacterium cerinum]UUC46945.1 MG2 domain-containing protein [Flavobacterium cerinum]